MVMFQLIEEDLPQVCDMCLDTLTRIHKLREVSLQSEEYFKSSISSEQCNEVTNSLEDNTEENFLFVDIKDEDKETSVENNLLLEYDDDKTAKTSSVKNKKQKKSKQTPAIGNKISTVDPNDTPKRKCQVKPKEPKQKERKYKKQIRQTIPCDICGKIVERCVLEYHINKHNGE